MKNIMQLLTFKTLLCALLVGLSAGCAATRPIADTAFGAGGAYLGHELSNGDPLATAAGAASGPDPKCIKSAGQLLVTTR